MELGSKCPIGMTRLRRRFGFGFDFVKVCPTLRCTRGVEASVLHFPPQCASSSDVLEYKNHGQVAAQEQQYVDAEHHLVLLLNLLGLLELTAPSMNSCVALDVVVDPV